MAVLSLLKIEVPNMVKLDILSASYASLFYNGIFFLLELTVASKSIASQLLN